MSLKHHGGEYESTRLAPVMLDFNSVAKISPEEGRVNSLADIVGSKTGRGGNSESGSHYSIEGRYVDYDKHFKRSLVIVG